jgi:hypothetical protein
LDATREAAAFSTARHHPRRRVLDSRVPGAHARPARKSRRRGCVTRFSPEKFERGAIRFCVVRGGGGAGGVDWDRGEAPALRKVRSLLPFVLVLCKVIDTCKK